jgi:hypothetical protein
VENLEWVSNQQNRDHAVSNSLIAKGETCGGSKLNNKDILEIFKLSKHLLQKDIAIKYNVGQQTISRILNKKTWKHISEDL